MSGWRRWPISAASRPRSTSPPRPSSTSTPSTWACNRAPPHRCGGAARRETRANGARRCSARPGAGGSCGSRERPLRMLAERRPAAPACAAMTAIAADAARTQGEDGALSRQRVVRRRRVTDGQPALLGTPTQVAIGGDHAQRQHARFSDPRCRLRGPTELKTPHVPRRGRLSRPVRRDRSSGPRPYGRRRTAPSTTNRSPSPRGACGRRSRRPERRGRRPWRPPRSCGPAAMLDRDAGDRRCPPGRLDEVVRPQAQANTARRRCLDTPTVPVKSRSGGPGEAVDTAPARSAHSRSISSNRVRSTCHESPNGLEMKSCATGSSLPQTDTVPGEARCPSPRNRSQTPSAASSGRTSGEGCRPTRRPARERSSSATERPAAASVIAHVLPAGPPPTTTASKSATESEPGAITAFAPTRRRPASRWRWWQERRRRACASSSPCRQTTRPCGPIAGRPSHLR